MENTGGVMEGLLVIGVVEDETAKGGSRVSLFFLTPQRRICGEGVRKKKTYNPDRMN